MRHSIFLLILLFNISILKASKEVQNQIDSIKLSLEKETNEVQYIEGLLAWNKLVYKNDPKQSEKLFLEILDRCNHKPQDSLTAELQIRYRQYRANAYTGLGIAYHSLNDNEKALTNYLKALEIHEADSNLYEVARANSGIGVLYGDIYEHEKAIKYYDNILNLDIDLGIGRSITLHNKATNLVYLNRIEEALVCLYESIDVGKKDSVGKRELAYGYIELSRTYQKIGESDSAKYYCSRSIEEAIKFNDEFALAYSYIIEAEIYRADKNYNKTIASAEKALELSQKMNHLITVKDAREILFESYKALGNSKEAIEQLTLFHEVKDSLDKVQVKSLLVERDLRQEYEKEALADSLLKVQQTELLSQKFDQSIEYQKNKTQLTYLFIGFILLISLLAWIAYKQKKTSNLILAEKYDLVQQSLEAKERFMKEIHFRVKSDMQMVSSLLQFKASETDSIDVKKELNDSQSRIHSMSLAHAKMYEDNNFERINLTSYIKEIINYVLSSHPGSTAKGFDFSGNDILINVEQAQAVGFIVHELALNSVKYAWEEDSVRKLKVSVEDDRGSITIKYADNGKGLPADFNFDTASSMGLKLVRSFTKRTLKGVISFLSDNGTKVQLSFSPRV